MDAELTPEQEELRSTVRRFLAARAPVTPWVRDRLDDPRGTTDDVWRGLADLGVTGLLVPEEHGGAGRGMVDMGVVLEELGRVVHPGPFLSSAVTAVLTIEALGSPDSRRELLPGLADGSRIAAVALPEPTTKAVDTELSGAKAHVPDAVAADLLLVTAADEEGTGVYVVERNAPGLAIEATPTVDGTRTSATLTLDATPGRRLGPGDATGALAGVVDRTVLALVVDGVGTASAALDMALEHARTRVQFGRPIGSFQAVKHLCADMLVEVESARSAAYHAIWAADHDPEELPVAASLAKAYCSDAFTFVAGQNIQVHGGVGFTWEHPAHLYLKRAKTDQLLLGDALQHRRLLARRIGL